MLSTPEESWPRLSHREQEQAEALAMAHIGLFEWDLDSRAVWWSDEIYRIHGMDPAGQPITFERSLGMIAPADRARIQKTLATFSLTAGGTGLDYAIVRVDGVVRDLHGKARLLATSKGTRLLLGVLQDITDRKRLETRAAAADRLATLGIMAGGIAHEINNPLTGVLANAGFLREDLASMEGAGLAKARPQLLQMLIEMEEGAKQIRDVVQALKVFSRSEQVELRPVDIHELLDDVVKRVHADLGTRAQLDKTYDQRKLLVRGDQSELGQVFMNLLVNAAQAVATDGHDRGRVRLATALSPDGRIVVEVSDTGPGMSPEVQARLFTPFFTTKRVGAGRGLGLSLCRAIVEQHAGEIQVESALAKGSVFRVLLPGAL